MDFWSQASLWLSEQAPSRPFAGFFLLAVSGFRVSVLSVCAFFFLQGFSVLILEVVFFSGSQGLQSSGVEGLSSGVVVLLREMKGASRPCCSRTFSAVRIITDHSPRHRGSPSKSRIPSSVDGVSILAIQA